MTDRSPPDEADLYIPRKASSEVWKPFRLSTRNPSQVWCTVCGVWLAWKKTTSNLLLHCNSRHAATDLMKKKGPRTPSGDSRRRWRSSSSWQDESKLLDFKSLLVDLLIEDFLPPTVLKGRGFMKFASTLNPRFQTVTQNVLFEQLESVHRHVSTHIAKLLEQSKDGFSLAVEVWGEGRFASVTAHFLNPLTFQAADATLSVSYWEEDIDVTNTDALGSSKKRQKLDESMEVERADSLSKMKPREQIILRAINEALEAWRLPSSRILSVTTPSEELSCAQVHQKCGIRTHILCLATLLNRVMSSGLEKFDKLFARCYTALGINDMAPDSKSWVFRARVLGDLSRRALGIPDDQPPFISELYASPPEVNELLENADTVLLIHSLARLLYPSAEAAERFSRESRTPALSCVWTVFEDIVENATKLSVSRDVHGDVRKAAYFIAQELSTALSILAADEAETALLCAVLDPRFKTSVISGESKFVTSEREATALLRRNYVAQKNRMLSSKTEGLSEGFPVADTKVDSSFVSPESGPPEELSIPEAGKDQATDDLATPTSSAPPLGSSEPESFQRRPDEDLIPGGIGPPWPFSEPPCDEVAGTLMEDELSLYLGEVAAPPDSDPGTWWAERQSKYPVLAAIAGRVLAVPSMAVSAKKAFPTTADLHGEDVREEKERMNRREVLGLSKEASPAFVQTIAYLNANRFATGLNVPPLTKS